MVREQMYDHPQEGIQICVTMWNFRAGAKSL